MCVFLLDPFENDTSTVFHQCSDVLLTPPSELSAEELKTILARQQATVLNSRVISSKNTNNKHAHNSPAKSSKPSQTSGDCCTVDQFTIAFDEFGSVRGPATGFYYYDNINKLMRVSNQKLVPPRHT